MTGRHARRTPPWAEWALVVVVAGVVVCAALSLGALLRVPDASAVQPARTVTVPGPTVTQSFLILRTVTPGVNGF